MMRYSINHSQFVKLWESCMAARGYTAGEITDLRLEHIGR